METEQRLSISAGERSETNEPPVDVPTGEVIAIDLRQEALGHKPKNDQLILDTF